MLTAIVASGLISLFGVSFSVGLLSSSRTRADKDAADTWRAIVHRNAITEPIPFASSVARVNAPGLVQVHPRRSQPPHTEEPAPTPTPEPVRSALPAPRVRRDAARRQRFTHFSSSAASDEIR